MIPYAKIAALVAAMALGAAICVWGYATPRIAGLQKQIADIRAADAIATAQFEADARKVEKERQDERYQAQASFLAAQAEASRRIAGLDANGKRLRDQIAAYASGQALRLPGANQSFPGPDESALAGWGLLGSCLGVAEQSAGQAEQLANQVRGLQAIEAAK